MPDPATRPAASTPISRSALRIVLFGMPDAGKSSLLGALAQAAQTQEHVLNGHLSDTGQGLAEMHRRLYDESPRQTLDEVIPFPVSFEPFAGRPQDQRAGRLEAVLIDCDGRAANDLLSRRRVLSASGSNGALGQAILEADALILVVDSSARPAQIEADFSEFTRFLRLFEQSRGQQAAVGGLPVFLVLTKCDLLAQEGEDLADWMERIEEQKRQVGQRFETFLARDIGGAVPFGSIELHVWATAVKRPALLGSLARPREPYGVAELFRQAFDRARDFRTRQTHSGRRLLWTVAGTALVVGLMSLLAALLLLTRPSGETSELEILVDKVRSREQDQSPFARHRQPRTRLDEFHAFRKDPAFAVLPDAKKEYVERRIQELSAYLEFEKQLSALPDPREIRGEAALRELEGALTKVVVPMEYRTEWAQTEAGRRLTAWTDDVQALGRAVQTVTQGYEQVIRNGKQVLADAGKPQLPSRAQKVLDEAKSLPDPKSDAAKHIPGSDRLTYAAVFEFPSVQEVVRQWEDKNDGIKGKLVFVASLKTP